MFALLSFLKGIIWIFTIGQPRKLNGDKIFIILGKKTPDDSIEFREVGKDSKIIKINNISEVIKTITDKRR